MSVPVTPSPSWPAREQKGTEGPGGPCGAGVAAVCIDERLAVEGLDGSGRAIVLETRALPLVDRTRGGQVVAEGISSAVVLPRR